MNEWLKASTAAAAHEPQLIFLLLACCVISQRNIALPIVKMEPTQERARKIKGTSAKHIKHNKIKPRRSTNEKERTMM